jgi:hypothetical protein
MAQRTIIIQTSGQGLYEFTDETAEFVRKASVETGLLTVFVRHTSASLLVQENADPDVRVECVKPIAGTDSCQVSHLIHVISGRIVVRMDDGSEAEFGPGDMGSIPLRHDAWIAGSEPFISIDFPDCRTRL